jgi:hypothetical protein
MTAIEGKKQNFEEIMKKINPLPLRGEGSVVKPSSGHWNQNKLGASPPLECWNAGILEQWVLWGTAILGKWLKSS